MNIWRMSVACWIAKATNTHSQYVILTAVALQQWSRERASTLRLYVHCLPLYKSRKFAFTDRSVRHAGAQSVEALRYNPEGRGFDSRLCRWNFSLA